MSKYDPARDAHIVETLFAALVQLEIAEREMPGAHRIMFGWGEAYGLVQAARIIVEKAATQARDAAAQMRETYGG